MTWTVAELVARTATALDVPARPTTVDGLDAGDPEAVVRGVAVTTLATLGVLERAVAVGANVVVTHEPLFYDHLGAATAQLAHEGDPVHAAKAAFVREHGLAVWRMHDAWHDRRPDGIDVGTARALGWTLDPEAAARGVAWCDVRPTTVRELARHVAAALGSTQTRFAGDPHRTVRRVGLDLGFRGFARHRSLLRTAGVDAVVMGEAHEWETASYAADLAHLDGTGLVVAGHVPSEQAGMSLFADWLHATVPEVPVTFLSTPDLLVAA
ncbi:Nif3-like dinuclear metal center hexameric protein [Isoptericola sp. S6320L]|uniref:Nif3-like dinuclear metal center hexameric protein n=1 Tax=Isoptericola sp. S6320L TaxID=2926411 RepID=UPI001FF67B37|nr:Nif3-like dinuclear metal center hexameric protein [Isoptericola sp. S6320L]MCK0116087.1 Nif3-like dinuclear metal center hexameric protein [Isoptericola sp. S6320L]